MSDGESLRGPERRLVAGLLAALLAIAGALSLVDATRDSATADEPIHVAAGVAQVKSGAWLVNLEHPPLAKQLFGLGASWAGAREGPRLSYSDFFRSARHFLFLPRSGQPVDRVLTGARIVAVLLFVSFLFVAHHAAGGGVAGLLAVALLAGNTALFPHGHLVTTDVPVTLGIALTAASVASLALRPTLPRALLTAFLLAAALATKYSAVLLLGLVPVALLAAAATPPGRAPRSRYVVLAVTIPLSALLLLSLFLHLYTAGEPRGALDTLSSLHQIGPSDRSVIEGIDRFDTGLGRYAFGLLVNLRQAQAGRLTVYLGERTTHPGALYHLVALVVKSPLVWLVAVAAGIFLSLSRSAPPRARYYLLGGLLFLIASLPGPRIGVRHVFPAVALLSIGAALALARPLRRRGTPVLVATLLVAVAPLAFGRTLGGSGFCAHLFRDPPLADSNLDWGQDLLRLRALLAMRGIPASDLSIVYFGGDVAALRVPGATDLLESDVIDVPPRRYLAVSRQILLVGPETALFRNGVPRARRVLESLARDPSARLIGRAGESIELYDLGPRAPGTAPAGSS